mmetsp:Transcript_16407/g.35930  ORF Transcript_16407/g.35930 Transcript_16407/m.35930 type:complete len:222 (-) Transcript_16407:150-815(-)
MRSFARGVVARLAKIASTTRDRSKTAILPPKSSAPLLPAAAPMPPRARAARSMAASIYRCCDGVSAALTKSTSLLDSAARTAIRATSATWKKKRGSMRSMRTTTAEVPSSVSSSWWLSSWSSSLSSSLSSLSSSDSWLSSSLSSSSDVAPTMRQPRASPRATASAASHATSSTPSPRSRGCSTSARGRRPSARAQVASARLLERSRGLGSRGARGPLSGPA